MSRHRNNEEFDFLLPEAMDHLPHKQVCLRLFGRHGWIHNVFRVLFSLRCLVIQAGRLGRGSS